MVSNKFVLWPVSKIQENYQKLAKKIHKSNNFNKIVQSFANIFAVFTISYFLDLKLFFRFK